MKVGDARCQLLKKGFYLRIEEGFGHVFKEGLEIVFEKVQDEEDAAVYD